MPENRRMEFRIGVNLGDVIEDEERIYGDGVNIAARLEGLAEAGGICISGTAFDHVKNKLSLGYQYLGKQTVKNIADPVRAYKVLMEPESAGKVIGEKKPKQRSWGGKLLQRWLYWFWWQQQSPGISTGVHRRLNLPPRRRWLSHCPTSPLLPCCRL